LAEDFADLASQNAATILFLRRKSMNFDL